jgi:hypothetical protein
VFVIFVLCQKAIRSAIVENAYPYSSARNFSGLDSLIEIDGL